MVVCGLGLVRANGVDVDRLKRFFEKLKILLMKYSTLVTLKYARLRRRLYGQPVGKPVAQPEQ